jgi:O-antigen/teichoic acid export membrane protein
VGLLIVTLKEILDHNKKRFYSFLYLHKIHLQNLSALVIVNFILMGLSFVTNVKIANVMGREGFGQLAYGIVIGTYGATVVWFGLDRTLVRDIIHHPDKVGVLLSGSLVLRGSVMVFFLLGLLAWKVLSLSANNLSWGVVAIAIATTFKSLDFQAVYDSWQKMQRHAVYKLIEQLLYFTLVWIVAIFLPTKLTNNWVGIALLTSVILYLVIQGRWVFGRVDFRHCRNTLLKVAISLGQSNVWIWLGAFAALSFGYFNQLVLKHFSGTAELGGYAAAWQFVTVASVLLSQIARVGNPSMARVTREDTDKPTRIRFLIKYSGVMFATAALICLPVLFFPGFILRTVFRPEYVSVAESLRIMGVYVMVFSLGLVAAQYIVSAHMEKVYFISVVVGACLSVALCFTLIPKWSGFGAAVSLLVSHGICMGLYWVAMINDIRARSKG